MNRNGDLKRSKLRLAALLGMDAPDPILRGEARILLARIEGGKQKAIVAWQWALIRNFWTDHTDDLRLWWLGVCGWPEECAMSMLFGGSKKSEHTKRNCKTCAMPKDGEL